MQLRPVLTAARRLTLCASYVVRRKLRTLLTMPLPKKTFGLVLFFPIYFVRLLAGRTLRRIYYSEA